MRPLREPEAGTRLFLAEQVRSAALTLQQAGYRARVSWFSWIVVGFLAGVFAKMATGQRQPGCLGTIVVGIIGGLLGGAIFIEAVFGLNGLGGTALESIGRFDLPVLQGVVIFGAIAIIIFSLVVDLLYAWIDPRIRLT